MGLEARLRLFITGISGLLGLNLAQHFRRQFDVSGCYFSHPISMYGVQAIKLDLLSYGSVQETLGGIRPDVIVHTAALTDVDGCERNPNLARQINVEVARHIASISCGLGAQLVHISTDHLFDGESPWMTELDEPTPLNAYATTKWEAEQVVSQACPEALIVRTNFYGWGTSLKPSFSDWVLKGLEKSLELPMFSDVFFTPILINDLADSMAELIARRKRGTLHVAGSERLSKHEFALQMAKEFNCTTENVRATSINNIATQVMRPKDMSLSSKLAENYLGREMPTTSLGLKRLHSLREAAWPQTLEMAISSTDRQEARIPRPGL